MAGVGAQLTKRLLLTPDAHSSNPVLGNILCRICIDYLLLIKQKEGKRCMECPIKD